MSADDDIELRDLVIESLEKKGVLGKIKAELRATVFLALEENEQNLSDGNKHANSTSQQELWQFLDTTQGMLVYSLVRDFLEQFQLHFSLAVLDPEVSHHQKCIPRNELGTILKLYPESDTSCPLLSLLLSNNASSLANNKHDLNANCTQPTKNTYMQNDTFEKPALNADNLNGSLTIEKDYNDNKPKPIYKSPILGDDPFFDDTPSSPKNNPLFYNFLNKPLVPKVGSDLVDAKHLVSSNQLEKPKEISRNDDKAIGGNVGLSSLKDLPSLVTNDSTRPKEGRRLWNTEPEEREKFMNLTFGKTPELLDLFPQPASERKLDLKEPTKPDPEKKDPDPDGSIEEDIEEDLFSIGDDLLTSSKSSKEDDLTVDKTVSGFSKAGGFDYMENLT